MIFSFRCARRALLGTAITASLIACGQDGGTPTTQTIDDNTNGHRSPLTPTMTRGYGWKPWRVRKRSTGCGSERPDQCPLAGGRPLPGTVRRSAGAAGKRGPHSLRQSVRWVRVEFMADADHSHGLWRRTTLDSYLTEEPDGISFWTLMPCRPKRTPIGSGEAPTAWPPNTNAASSPCPREAAMPRCEESFPSRRGPLSPTVRYAPGQGHHCLGGRRHRAGGLGDR